MKKTETWAILGGGNGGQALAGHLSIMGAKTRLYDIFPATVKAITARGGVTLKGAAEGTGAVELASQDIAAVLRDVDHVMVTVPSTAHAELAKLCAPHLRDGQFVFIHPGATLGALDFYNTLKKAGCTAKVVISETNSLIYACRAEEPGVVVIHGIKSELMLGTIPSAKTPEAVAVIGRYFPQITAARNVLESSAANGNAILHPAPSLLNASLIESDHEWRYYVDGFTPTISAFVEKLDEERKMLCKAMNVHYQSWLDWYRSAYGVTSAATLREAVMGNPAYQGIKGQKTLYTRYLLEDIPNSLVPLAELAKLYGVPTPRMNCVIQMAYELLGEENFGPARTLEYLGCGSFSSADLERYISSGQ